MKESQLLFLIHLQRVIWVTQFIGVHGSSRYIFVHGSNYKVGNHFLSEICLEPQFHWKGVTSPDNPLVMKIGVSFPSIPFGHLWLQSTLCHVVEWGYHSPPSPFCTLMATLWLKSCTFVITSLLFFAIENWRQIVGAEKAFPSTSKTDRKLTK